MIRPPGDDDTDPEESLPSEDDDGEDEAELPGLGPSAEPIAPRNEAALPGPSRDPVVRRSRIRACTLDGGFKGPDLPLGFDADDDWLCITADDPFEKLFLDYRQAESISNETVKLHAMLLQQFWEEKVRMIDSGSADQASKVVRRFGGRSKGRVRGYPEDISSAAGLLATLEARQEAAAEVVAQAEKAMLAQIRKAIKDGELSVAEAEDLIGTDAAALGIDAADASRLLEALDTLLEKVELNRPIRLVGLAAFDFTREHDVAPRQASLFDSPSNHIGPNRNERLNQALDKIGAKYGARAIVRADVAAGRVRDPLDDTSPRDKK